MCVVDDDSARCWTRSNHGVLEVLECRLSIFALKHLLSPSHHDYFTHHDSVTSYINPLLVTSYHILIIHNVIGS